MKHAVFGLVFVLLACEAKKEAPKGPSTAADTELAELCARVAPKDPVVEQVGPRVFVARGFDLANVAMIHTDDGNVVIDASMNPDKGARIKQALLAKAPGPIKALIYTHSHLDHAGGASAFVEDGTEIWATDAFTPHFLKQYGRFQPIEALRGGRQYGRRVPATFLPCTALGPLPDIDAAAHSGVRAPTKTFSGKQTLTIGGVTIELVEAHGETHDMLFVWMPDAKTLFAGDNLYRAFPNLYTIRGTTARPVDDWILSIDKMRRLQPEILVPGHTEPVKGKTEIASILQAYRDGIAWVRDATIRGANAGLSPDQLAQSVKLPPHLAAHPYLQEIYGQVAWSVRSIYSDHLGWFGGEADLLYPLDQQTAAAREVALMGGPPKVLEAGAAALTAGDAAWAVHLLAKLRDSGLTSGSAHERLQETLAHALQRLAAETLNTNGRAYLASSAGEMTSGRIPLPAPDPDPTFIAALPIDVIIERMATALDWQSAMNVSEAIRLEFSDLKVGYSLVVRQGVLEATKGDPLPGSPEPLAVATVDSMTWKELALRKTNFATVLASGKLAVTGSWVGFGMFMKRFSQGPKP